MSKTEPAKRPITPRIGALIEGLDLARLLDDEQFEWVHQAWMDHLVLFLEGPRLTSFEHLALGERFGDLHIHPAAPFVADNPALMRIHTDASSERNNG